MRIVLIILAFLVFLTTYSQGNLPYKAGEYLAFDISFEGIKVGSAELEVKNQIEIENTPVFHIVGKGRTSSFFDWFFKVRDVYETHLDTSKIRPLKFLRDISEGGYEKKETYLFKHSENTVFFNDTSHLISSDSQDMLSAFFFARTFDREKIKMEKIFFVPIFMDEENYFLEVVYLYNEKIETNFGELRCMVFRPKMQEGRIFEDGEQMKIWISDDKNKLLAKVETEIWAGTIKAVLTDYKELKYPLSISQQNKK